MAFGRRSRGSRGIGIRDLAQYRTLSNDEAFDGRSVDVDRAARGLGVTKKTVRDVIANAQSALSGKVHRRLSGRTEGDTSQAATARGMLQAVFGRGPRGAAVNARVAAQELGVSPGTVRRWAAGTQKPSADRLTALRAAARRSTTTKRGRKAAVDEFRNSASGKDALQGGAQFWVYGYQGVPAPKDETSYSRDHRTIHLFISAEDVGQMLRDYEDRGVDGFQDWLREQGKAYMRGDGEWEFTDVYDFGFGGDRAR